MYILYIVVLDQDRIPLAMIQTMRKLKSGYINGTRVMLGNLKDFLNTSAITDLSFLGSTEEGYPERLHPDVQTYLDEHLLRSFNYRNAMNNNLRGGLQRPKHLRRRMSCKGAIRKTRSINVDCKHHESLVMSAMSDKSNHILYCLADKLGMEGPTPLMERRLSSLVAPTWLLPNKSNHVNVVFAKTPEEENTSSRNSSTVTEQQRITGKSYINLSLKLLDRIIYCIYFTFQKIVQGIRYNVIDRRVILRTLRSKNL